MNDRKSILDNVKGTRVRARQFSFLLYANIFILAVLLLSVLYYGICLDNITPSELTSGLLTLFVIAGSPVIIFTILTCLEHTRFGNVVCVINELGIFHENGFINWDWIQSIEYEIPFPRRYSFDYCRAYIYTDKGCVTILHAPLYLLRAAKKNSPYPYLEIKVSLKSKLMITFFVILVLVIFLLVPFLPN